METTAVGRSPGAERLSGHPIMHSSALDEVRDVVPRVYAPHQTFVRERNRRLRAVLNAATVGPVTVGYLRYGTGIHMVPALLTSCYHINLPVRGFTDSRSGRESIVSSPRLAAVFSPDQLPTELTWSSDCAQLAVKVDRGALHNELENILGRPVPWVRFELGMDTTSTRGRSWVSSLHLLLAELERPGSIVHEPLAGAQFARHLMSTLLFAQPHNHTEALYRPAAPARPHAVRQVTALVDAHPERRYSAGDLAAHANVSLRALQAGFRRQLGMSPMEYLTEIRLSRAHAELVDADPTEVTTTEVAHRWGFTHLGRFAGAYRRKYGLAPSDTLRRAR